MKYALAVTTILSIASSALAFEVDLNDKEAIRLSGRHTVSDLVVGTRARIGWPCQENGRLFISNTYIISSNGDFIVTLQPNGGASLEFSPVSNEGIPDTELVEGLRPMVFSSCSLWSGNEFSGNLIEVDDIDGFTTYSEWAQSVLQRFPLKE